jgi:hypothetical protein
VFIGDLPCVEHFVFITHDKTKISESTAKKLLGGEFYGTRQILTSDEFTVVLPESDNKLLVLGKKGKKIAVVDLDKLKGQEELFNELTKLLKIEGSKLWITHNANVFVYDLASKKVLTTLDFSQWKPRTMFMDGSEYWLINGEDGQLYGLR